MSHLNAYPRTAISEGLGSKCRTSRNHVINVIYGASDESGEDLMNLYICIRRSRIIRLIIGRVGIALIYYVFDMCGRTPWSCVSDTDRA